MSTRKPCYNAQEKAVSPEITLYVEQEVIPLYTAFDKAHREDHVRTVISRSMTLATHFPNINIDMVYLVAAFHDLGLMNGRDNHHHDSRRILEADTFIQSHFTPEEIILMGEAVEDHRASGTKRPRNDYGLIVAEADRCIDAQSIIRRTIQYGLTHYPELDRQGHYMRAMEHLRNKYSPNGYLKIWLPWSDNADNLKRFHALLSNENALNTLFTRIFDEETHQEEVPYKNNHTCWFCCN